MREAKFKNKIFPFLVIFFFMLVNPIQALKEKDSFITKSEIKKIINTVIKSFMENYVYPQKVILIKKGIIKNLKKKKYNNIKTLKEFANILREDIYEIVGDHHIDFRVIKKSNLSQERNKISLLSEKISDMAKKNFHIPKAEVLPGNIGYLRIDRFDDPNYASETVIAAVQFLANTDAIILDLRYNGGGHPSVLASYFLKNSIQLGELYFPRTDSTRQTWTHYVPGKKLIDTKLYILSSNQTGSAAEAFITQMKNKRKAKTIGETTRGSAHWVNYFFYPEIKIEIKMPIGRPIKNDWEGIGIKPDVEIFEHLALEKAYLTALKDLQEGAKDENIKKEYKWYQKVAEMKLKNLMVINKDLSEYAGKYGKKQLFIFRDGNLYWHQSTKEEFVLLPFSKDAFTFSNDEEYIVKFVRNKTNRIIGYKLLHKDTEDPTLQKRVSE